MFKKQWIERALVLMLAIALVFSFSFMSLRSIRVLAEADGSGDAETTESPAPTTGDDDKDEEKNDEEKAQEEKEAKEAKSRAVKLALIGAGIALVLAGGIAIFLFKKDKNNTRGIQSVTTKQLTESALMLAIATVCSLVKIDLPFGGGVTVASMLPLILISHRYGWRWGITVSFVYSLIQLIFGLDNVAYATSTAMAFGVIFLDYIVAYTVIGLSGIFGRSRKGVMIGTGVVFGLRFLCHYVTGVWIWGAWMPEKFMGMTMKSPWIYSALYNGWYMLAELIITEIIIALIYGSLKNFFENTDA